MTDRWFARRMTHTCVVQRDSGTARTSSGQIVESWADAGTRRPCRYIERSERVAREATAKAMLKERRLLMYGTSDVNVKDRIVRVWDEDDDEIQSGPFTVEEILTRRKVDGTVHHLSLRLERTEAQ